MRPSSPLQSNTLNLDPGNTQRHSKDGQLSKKSFELRGEGQDFYRGSKLSPWERMESDGKPDGRQAGPAWGLGKRETLGKS